MEKIEGTSRAAVESCHRVLNLLSRPHQQDHGYDMSLLSETREAVFRFKRVASLLSSSSSVGHARFRRAKIPHTHLSQSIFLDPCLQRTEPQTAPVMRRSGFHELSLGTTDCLTLGTRSFGLNSNAKAPFFQLNQQAVPSSNYLNMFPEHQQQQQQQQQLHERLHQQQQRHQAEIILRNCNNGGISLSFDNSSCTPTMSSTRSFISSLSVDGSVLEGNSSFHLVGAPSSTDQSSQYSKRKYLMRGDEHGSVKCGSSSRCHCSKKRKHRVRRSIRVPAISNKVADIPPDDYSWRKYGQKPIKGSPYPRCKELRFSYGQKRHYYVLSESSLKNLSVFKGYYKCSSMRGCPARKHVERCLEDPAMLIVTYEAEHNHPKLPSQTVTP